MARRKEDKPTKTAIQQCLAGVPSYLFQVRKTRDGVELHIHPHIKTYDAWGKFCTQFRFETGETENDLIVTGFA